MSLRRSWAPRWRSSPRLLLIQTKVFLNALMGSIHCLAGAIRTQKDDPKTAAMKPFSSMPFKPVVRRLALVAGHVKAPETTAFLESSDSARVITLGAKNQDGIYSLISSNVAELGQDKFGGFTVPADSVLALHDVLEFDYKMVVKKNGDAGVPLSPLSPLSPTVGGTPKVSALPDVGLDALSPMEVRQLCTALLSANALPFVPHSAAQAAAAAGAGKSAAGKAQGPGTAHALTALLPRTFDLHAAIRDHVKPLGESTVSELDSDGNPD